MSQVWLITGTSSGLGHELARAVLGRGDKVIATARQLDRISSLKDLGAATLQLDVTAPQEELNRRAEEAIAIYGRIDVLVNNAGYVQFGTIEETSHDQWFKQFNTNVFGTLNTTRSFLPHMRRRKSGVIVFIGSMVAWDGAPTVGAYASSKAAIHYAVDSLSKEVAPMGLKTLLIEPGTFKTDFLSWQNSKSVEQQIKDYRELSENMDRAFADLNGKQLGDPKKGVNIIIDVVKGKTGAVVKTWPSSLPLGSDAIEVIRKQCENTLQEIDEWETLSKSTDF
ncbi:hypothetical protein N7509_005885 [Penicillium cosmopolitanum]|uniref:Uncharacterized protein n=1 Tax=Penicillium cosmopolitanum TaxID=1131564 RepID=A0A9X0BAI3_9EURO|nr:uncharacterized protein N7509_005885 [Penicillium cosmopolitanum]KAJ5397772.1 hypothetical protein N7509_005885 [Penicillium cosmopolitanum]